MARGVVSGPVVDTGAAEEFVREILARASEQVLESVAVACARKSESFVSVLEEGQLARAGRDDLRRLLRQVFSCRRRADEILDAVGSARLAADIDQLLHGSGPVGPRIEAFDQVLEAVPGIGLDLPGELLHFSDPDRHWLWTRWMWDPRTETGALPLVTM